MVTNFNTVFQISIVFFFGVFLRIYVKNIFYGVVP